MEILLWLRNGGEHHRSIKAVAIFAPSSLVPLAFGSLL